MADYQGPSLNGPHGLGEPSYSASKERIEHRDDAERHPNQQGHVPVHPHDPALRQGAMVSQVLAPSFKPGNPGPLGLLSFALTTFALGLYECGAGYV